jgi:hypothetical protein
MARNYQKTEKHDSQKAADGNHLFRKRGRLLLSKIPSVIFSTSGKTDQRSQWKLLD